LGAALLVMIKNYLEKVPKLSNDYRIKPMIAITG
jgi:hypothetical protein